MPIPGWVAREQESLARAQGEAQGRAQGARLSEAVTVLRLLLDAMDYERGACQPNEMVGAVLPVEILRRARAAAGMP
jgi:hypothetical protein